MEGGDPLPRVTHEAELVRKIDVGCCRRTTVRYGDRDEWSPIFVQNENQESVYPLQLIPVPSRPGEALDLQAVKPP